MQWYEGIINELNIQEEYTHNDIITALIKRKPGLADSTYHWALTCLLREKKLYKHGYDAYALADGTQHEEYMPIYSDEANKVMDSISQAYPRVEFTVFETVLMNEFLNHLIAQNTIFVQVEKESSIFVFRHLQENGYQNLMYKPARKEFDLYWEKDCIVVTDIISEAPVRGDKPHLIMIEKMLVDMLADRLISGTYSKAEYQDVMEQAYSRYRIDKTRMLRYARRRNKHSEIQKYLEGSIKQNAFT